MKRAVWYFFVCCVAILICALSGATLTGAQQQAALVIEGGTLIDGNGGSPVADGVIVIQGNRITAVSRKGQASYPSTAQIVHADGKYILPGFWEAETVYGWFGGESELLHGVTSISD